MKHYHNNPRQISKAQFKRLQETMREFGDLSGIIHNLNTDEIIGGNQRSEAAALLHQEPVIVERFEPPQEDGTVALGYFDVDGRRFSYRAVRWDEDKAARANLIANVAGGSWDWDALSSFPAQMMEDVGFDKDLLTNMSTDFRALGEFMQAQEAERNPQGDAEPEIDRAEELQAKWQVKTGDLWKIGEHRLLCGDSTKREDVERVMGNEEARLIWTDPPYGVNYGEKLEASNPMGYRVRSIENDDLPADQLEKFIRSAMKNAAEFSVAGAAIYVACPAGTLLPALIASFAGSGFEYRWGLIWLKDQIVLSRADYHFKHENILYGWKPDGAHYFTEDRTQASVFEYPRPKSSEEHPTMKPVALIQHMLRNSSERNDIIYDCFGGSGSTMLASENEGRQCRMVELAPKYCAVTLERMAQAFHGIEIERIE